MGDRCYLNIRIHPDDYALAKSVLGSSTFQGWPDSIQAFRSSGAPESGDFWADELCLKDGLLVVEEYEANWGWYEQLNELGKEGCRFVAYNGQGDNYSYGVTIGTGILDGEVNGEKIHRFHELATNQDGVPVVEVNRHGNIPPEVQKLLRQAMRDLRNIEREFSRLKEKQEPEG